MAQTWDDLDQQDRWTLSTDEFALLSGMTGKGRLAFAVQLKFMELYGRFPESAADIDPATIRWVSAQLHVDPDDLLEQPLDDRQGVVTGGPFVFTWIFVPALAPIYSAWQNGWPTMFCRSTRKPVTVAMPRWIGFARSAWSPPPSVSLIGRSVQRFAAMRPGFTKPFMRACPARPNALSIA